MAAVEARLHARIVMLEAEKEELCLQLEQQQALRQPSPLTAAVESPLAEDPPPQLAARVVELEQLVAKLQAHIAQLQTEVEHAQGLAVAEAEAGFRQCMGHLEARCSEQLQAELQLRQEMQARCAALEQRVAEQGLLQVEVDACIAALQQQTLGLARVVQQQGACLEQEREENDALMQQLEGMRARVRVLEWRGGHATSRDHGGSPAGDLGGADRRSGTSSTGA
jgi:chromosome segregation ATPase